MDTQHMIAKDKLTIDGHNYSPAKVEKLAEVNGISEESMNFVERHLQMFPEEAYSPYLPPIGGGTEMFPFMDETVLTFSKPAAIANGTRWGVAIVLSDCVSSRDFYRSTITGNRVASVAPGTTRTFGYVSWEYFDDTNPDPTVFDVVNPGVNMHGSWSPTVPDTSSPYQVHSGSIKVIDVSPTVEESGQFDVVHYAADRVDDMMFFGVDDATAKPQLFSKRVRFPQKPNEMSKVKNYAEIQKGEGALVMQRFLSPQCVNLRRFVPDLLVPGNLTGTQCWYQASGAVSSATASQQTTSCGQTVFLVFRGGGDKSIFKSHVRVAGALSPLPGSTLYPSSSIPPSLDLDAFELINESYRHQKAGYPAYYNDEGWLSRLLNNTLGYVLDDWAPSIADTLLPSSVSTIAKKVVGNLQSNGLLPSAKKNASTAPNQNGNKSAKKGSSKQKKKS